MRIAMVVGKFPAVSESFVLNQLKGLIDRGHDVDIFVFYGKEDGVVQDPDIEQYDLLSRTHYLDNSKGFQRYSRLIIKLIKQFFLSPQKCFQVLSIKKSIHKQSMLNLMLRGLDFVNKQPYDIVYNQFGMLGLYMLPYRHFHSLSGKYVIAFRGADISSYLRVNGEAVYEELFKQGDLFLPNCSHFESRLSTLGCDLSRTSIIRSGINLDRFVYNPKDEKSDQSVQVLFCGRLVEKKGLFDAVRAFDLALKENPNLQLVIIGDGPLHTKLVELINQLNLKNKVSLLGALTQDNIVKSLSQSDIFLSPNRTSQLGDTEGVTNTVKEAGAVGIPIISTYHGGIPEYLEDGVNGYLLEEGDIKGMSERLIQLSRDPELRRKMGVEGRKKVESEYNIEKLNDLLEQKLLKLFK